MNKTVIGVFSSMVLLLFFIICFYFNINAILANSSSSDDEKTSSSSEPLAKKKSEKDLRTAARKAREKLYDDIYRRLPGSQYHVLELDDDTFEDTIFPTHKSVTSQRPFLIMFYAPWCNLCKTVLPLFDNASRLLHSDEPSFREHNLREHSARMAIIDAVANPRIAHKLHVTSYPTYFYSVNGRLYEYHGSPSANSFAQSAISIYRGFMFGSFVDDVTNLKQFKALMAVESPSRPVFVFCVKTRNSKRKAASAAAAAGGGGASNNNDGTSKKKGNSAAAFQQVPLRLPDDAGRVLAERLHSLAESRELYISSDNDDINNIPNGPQVVDYNDYRNIIDYGFLNDDAQTNAALLASSKAKDMRDEYSVVAEAFVTNARGRFGVIYEDEAANADPLPSLDKLSDNGKDPTSNKAAYMNRKRRLLRPKERTPDAISEAMYWSLRFRCQEIRDAATTNIISASTGKAPTKKDWTTSSGPYDTLLNLLPPPTLGPNNEILLVSSDLLDDEPVHFSGSWGYFAAASEDLLKYAVEPYDNLLMSLHSGGTISSSDSKSKDSAAYTTFADEGYVRTKGSSTFIPSFELDEFIWRYGHRGVEKINGDILASLSQKGKVGILVVNGDIDFTTDRKYMPILKELAHSRFMDYHNELYEKGAVEKKKAKTMEELRESVVLSGESTATRIDGINAHQLLNSIGGSLSPQYNRVKVEQESNQFIRHTAYDKIKEARDKSMASLTVLDGALYDSWLLSLGYAASRRLPVFCIIDPIKEIVWIMEEWLSPENRRILTSEEPYGAFGTVQLEAMRDFILAVDAGEVRGMPLSLMGSMVHLILDYVPFSYVFYEFVGSDNNVFIGGFTTILILIFILAVTFHFTSGDSSNSGSGSYGVGGNNNNNNNNGSASRQYANYTNGLQTTSLIRQQVSSSFKMKRT